MFRKSSKISLDLYKFSRKSFSKEQHYHSKSCEAKMAYKVHCWVPQRGRHKDTPFFIANIKKLCSQSDQTLQVDVLQFDHAHPHTPQKLSELNEVSIWVDELFCISCIFVYHVIRKAQAKILFLSFLQSLSCVSYISNHFKFRVYLYESC